MTDCITDQIIGLMMDWIMSTEIRNFAWLPKIKSVWHNGVQAPLGVFFFVHSKSDYMEFWGKKWACTPFCHADSLLAGYATSQIFIEHMLIFSPPPPTSFLKLFSFVNNFLVLFFKPLFFDLWSNQRGFGPKNTSSGAFTLLCQADLILARHT